MLILFVLLILLLIIAVIFIFPIKFSLSAVAAENGVLLKYSFSLMKIVFYNKKKRIIVEDKTLYIYTYKNDKLISKKPIQLKKKNKPKKKFNRNVFLLSLKKDIRIEKFDLFAQIHTPRPDLTAMASGLVIILISTLCAFYDLTEKNSNIEIKPEFENASNLFNLSCIISLKISNIITAYLKLKKE